MDASLTRPVRWLLALLAMSMLAIGLVRLVQDAQLVNQGTEIEVIVRCGDAVSVRVVPASLVIEPVKMCNASYDYRGLPFDTVIPHGVAAADGSFRAYVLPDAPDTPYVLDAASDRLFSALTAGGAALLYLLVRVQRPAARNTVVRRPPHAAVRPRRVPTAEERWGVTLDRSLRAQEKVVAVPLPFESFPSGSNGD